VGDRLLALKHDDPGGRCQLTDQRSSLRIQRFERKWYPYRLQCSGCTNAEGAASSMGIQGLLPHLKGCSRSIHVRDYKGRKVVVDGYSWLHKGAYTCARELCEGIYTDRQASSGYPMDSM